MSKNKITIKVPGKLMVAGEFAVLVPHHHLIVTAVNRFVYVTIEDDLNKKLSLVDFGLNDLSWNFNHDMISVGTDDRRISFVKKAMEVTCIYLREQGVELDDFHLTIHSELDDESGVKYGLGSSAAVVSAVVSAIMARFLGEDVNKDVIFKLAAIAHVTTQGNGSGADIAASVYGGVLQYSSFQAEWLQKQYEDASSISELVNKDWKYLSLKRIELPDSVYFCVGWTGNPASTTKLVDLILDLKVTNPRAFEEFLEKSETAVHKILQGLEEENYQLLVEGVKENRQSLREVGSKANAPIETPLLTKLCDLADQLGGSGKPSGAGGGDCGIGFMPSEEKAFQLFEEWNRAGIKPLNLKSYSIGAIIVEN